MYDKKKWRWVCPDTGNTYDLKHMREFVANYGVKLAKGTPTTGIACRVTFSNHCFTRSRNSEDSDKHAMVREAKRAGSVEERIFCSRRWDFSQQLPEIIRDLTYRNCLEGGSKEIVYRQEGRSGPGEHQGWYICMRLNFSSKREPQLELWVRSVHWRQNRPIDVRGHGGKRFCMILSEYLKKRL